MTGPTDASIPRVDVPRSWRPGRRYRPAFRARALAGALGPAAFAAAWIFGTARQHGRDGYTAQVEQISGLAAPDARHPMVMTGGFLVHGACTWIFASALDDLLGGPGRAGWAPRLTRLGAVGIVGAGLLRRDRMLLIDLDGGENQSRQNDIHDAASAVAFTSLFLAPFALQRRLHGDPDLRPLVTAEVAATAVAAGVLIIFQAKRFPHYNGILQRLAVTLPMVPSAALALRLALRSQD